MVPWNKLVIVRTHNQQGRNGCQNRDDCVRSEAPDPFTERSHVLAVVFGAYWPQKSVALPRDSLNVTWALATIAKN